MLQPGAAFCCHFAWLHNLQPCGECALTKPEMQARQELKGMPMAKAVLEGQSGRTQQLRYTGSYGDTSFVVNAPEGDPATVYAHHRSFNTAQHMAMCLPS